MAAMLAVTQAFAQVPYFVNYQGRLAVGNSNFTGTAQFKFSLIDIDGSYTFWSNDGTGAGGNDPDTAVSLPVDRGLFSVRLGDTNLANMTTLSPTVFTNSNIRLRVWCDYGSGSERLYPDQVIASVGYAMMSAGIIDGAVTPSKLATNTLSMFVHAGGGAMTGPLTNTSGFFGNGAGLTNLAPGAYTETDPLFFASAARDISAAQTSNWTTAFLWGDHGAAGYLRASSNLADIINVPLARANLGLDTMALQASSNVNVSGGIVSNVSVAVKSDMFTVGTNQLAAVSNRVGIGTASPGSKLEVVGGTASGEYTLKIYSGTNLMAWGRKK